MFHGPAPAAALSRPASREGPLGAQAPR
jgi:hypothetical protein